MTKRAPRKFDFSRGALQALAASSGDVVRALELLQVAYVEHETMRALARGITDEESTRSFFRYWAKSASGLLVARKALSDAGADWVHLSPRRSA